MSSQAQISLIEDVPLCACFKVDLKMKIPAGCVGKERRSKNLVEIPITNYVTLKKGTRRVEIRTVLENKAKDHWLRVVFPTEIESRFQ